MSLLQIFLVLTVLASLANAHHLLHDPLCDQYQHPPVYTPNSNERVLFVVDVEHPLIYSLAKTECGRLHGYLFYPKNFDDHRWFVETINHQKNFRKGNPAKFWVGLKMVSNNVLSWVTEHGDFIPFENLHQKTIATGYEDETKNVAFAVPDGPGKAKYEFETNNYEAESYVCVVQQSIQNTKICQQSQHHH